MPPTAAEIVNLYNQRKKAHQGRITQMEEVKAAYEGKLDIPLPELDRNERPMVANLISQGIDQNAMRIASTMPNVTCPPMRAGFDVHEDNADDRRRAILGWWTMNKLRRMQSKRSRWLITYSAAPVMIRPHPKKRIPYWQERSPRTSLPPPGDDLTPTDMIFSFKKTLGWLRRIYPESIGGLDLGPRSAPVNPDTEFVIVEYCDDEILTQVVLGKATEGSTNADSEGYGGDASPRNGRPYVELDRLINLAGICPAVYPTRISLEDATGQFDGLVGLYWNMAMLMALEVIAVKRAIFEDEWIIGRQGETAQIITEADGLSGIRGEINGANVQKLGSQPGVMTYQTLDRIERAIRLTGGIPAEFGGESGNNIRTARRGGQVLSSAIDFSIAECQGVFEDSLEEENIRAIAIDRAYFKGSKSFYFSWNGAKGRGTYDPATLWATDENEVRYSFPGADINELIIGIGQRKGMGIMSDYRAMELDPLNDDPELERQRIAAEGLNRAFVQGLSAKIADGTIPPDDAAFIVDQLVTGKSDTEAQAVMKAQKRAQARQASEPSVGPAEEPMALPPGTPEAQPGLAAGPEGAGAAAASIPEPTSTMNNLQSLLAQRRAAVNAMR